MVREFKWDGEKIKETVKEEPKKHTPKDILNGLDNVRHSIQGFNDSIMKAQDQIKAIETNLQSATEFEKELVQFEEKCIKLQKEKLTMLINGIHQECYDKAVEDSNKEINESPEAYTEEQRKQLPYLKYQKYLSTHEKVSEKISGRIIREYLYEKPIFENPFKG